MSPVAQASRFLDRRGEALTIREFVAGAVNLYGDAAQTPANRTVQGFFEELGVPTIMRLPTGREVHIDGKAYVADGDEPVPALDAEKPTILITAAGLEYTVHRVGPDQNGVRTILCGSRR